MNWLHYCLLYTLLTWQFALLTGSEGELLSAFSIAEESDYFDVPVEGLVYRHPIPPGVDPIVFMADQPTHQNCNMSCTVAAKVSALFCDALVSPSYLQQKAPNLSRRYFGEGSGPHFVHALRAMMRLTEHKTLQETCLRNHVAEIDLHWAVSLGNYPGHRNVLDEVVASTLAPSAAETEPTVCNIGVGLGAITTAAALAASTRRAIEDTSRQAQLLTAQVGEILLSGNNDPSVDSDAMKADYARLAGLREWKSTTVSHPDALAHGLWQDVMQSGDCAVLVIDAAALAASPDAATMTAVLHALVSGPHTPVIIHGSGAAEAEEVRVSWDALVQSDVVSEDRRLDGRAGTTCLLEHVELGACQLCAVNEENLKDAPGSFLRVGHIVKEKIDVFENPFTLDVFSTACDGFNDNTRINGSIVDDIDTAMAVALELSRTGKTQISIIPPPWYAEQLLVMVCSLFVSLMTSPVPEMRVVHRVRLNLALDAAARSWLEPRLEKLFTAFSAPCALLGVELIAPIRIIDINLAKGNRDALSCKNVRLKMPSLLPNTTRRALYVDSDVLFVEAGAVESLARMVRMLSE